MKTFPIPRLPAGVRRLFRLPFRTFRRISRDVDDEVAFHLQMRADELTAAGMSPEAARAEALRRFGDAEELRAYCRSLERPSVVWSRVGEWVGDLGQDLRFAARQFGRSPGFSLVAVLTLGLGIGATSTIYSAVHHLLLSPLPYRDADRLVSLDEMAFHGRVMIAPTPEVVDAWRAGSRTLEGIEEYSSSAWTLRDGGESELVRGEGIGPNLVPFLGARPLLGRPFAPDDALPGSPGVALIGEGLWRRRYGASREVLGRTITLDGRPFAVVGVMPRDFGVAIFGDLDQRQLFVPLVVPTGPQRVNALGRLRRGITADEASRELSAIQVSDPGMGAPEPPEAHAVAYRDSFADRYRDTLLLLFGAVGLVLLIACANVANLLLMRAWSRQREFGIRTAIGAGRGRLIRQLLTESVALSVVGGGLGVLLAWRVLPLIAALRPRTMAALDEVRLDPAVLAWTLSLAVVTGVLFGLAPAFFGTKRRVSEALKDGGRSTAGRSGRLRGALVIGEIAVSMVLLISAGLLVRSLVALAHADEGLYPAGLMAIDLELPAERYPTPAARTQAFERIVERVRAVPGVEAGARALMSPWIGGVRLEELNVEGRAFAPGRKPAMLAFNSVAPDYFRTAGIPLLAGRVFTGDTSEHAVVVSQAFAIHYLPAGRWLGARIRFGEAGPWQTVVGIVADQRLPGEAGAPPPQTVYDVIAGRGRMGTILLRGQHPSALLPFVTRFIVTMDPGIHVLRSRTTGAAVAETRAQPRFVMVLLSAFAALALVLASVGLYGVVAFSVRQRTHEIGVRVALGAGANDVVRLVLRQGLGLALLGVVLGLGGAAAATRLIRHQLYEVGPGDPPTFLAVGGLLALVALAASLIPTRAALRIDPVEALRADG